MLKAKKSRDMTNNLEDEIQGFVDDLNFMGEHVEGSIYIVKSNHDEWIERYLST